MRILQVIHDFVDTQLAGSELYTYYLSKELKKRHEVAIMYYSNSESDFAIKEGEYHGLRTFIVNIPVTNMYRWSRFNYQNKQTDALFGKILSVFNPQIIHFQHLLFSSMNFPSIAKALRYPSIHTLHDFYLVCPMITLLDRNSNLCEKINKTKCILCFLDYFGKKNTVFRAYWVRAFYHLLWKRNNMVNKGVFRDVDLFISPSQFLMGKFIKYGLPPEKIIYSDNGMNTGIIKDNLPKRTSPACMTFGYLGGNREEKGIRLLIEAFNQIKSAQLHIYGKNVEKQYGDMAKNPNIKFKGLISDEQKAETFEEMDALIFPSICFENSPVAIHEAFMFQKAVITSDIGGMAELVRDGENGLLFRAGDVEELRRKIRYCINNPDGVRRMGQSAPKIKSIRENVEELEKIYEEIVSQRIPPYRANRGQRGK